MFAKFIGPYLKAHMAGIVSAAFLAVSDITNGGINTPDQWSVIAAAFLAAFGLTAIVPNGAAPAVATLVASAPQDDVVVAAAAAVADAAPAA